MKLIKNHGSKKVSNAWGRTIVVHNIDYLIEEKDIGRVQRDYNGYAGDFNRDGRNYTFKSSDVGKYIRHDTTVDGCWYFLDNKEL